MYSLQRAEHTLTISAPDGPLPIGLILGIGRNYAEHAREQGADVPDRPMVFMKSPATLIRDGEDVVIPTICADREQVDYEGELAVVIGRPRVGPSRDFSEDQVRDPASGVVLGYSIANDISARWWQKQGSGGQFCRGKSFDTFCPIGPHITPTSQVPDPQRLTLETRLNGEVVQSASTGEMIFPVAHLVAELSRGATLPPGTVILTGTPSGVGMSRSPQRFLRAGDEVAISISGLGTLRNRVRAE